MKRGFWARRILMFILIGAIAIFVFGGLVMLLWNNVLAEVTNVHPITFLQALGILILSKILFGGFRGAQGAKHHYWKRRMQQKWSNMAPEEREKFKQEWQKRCGGWGYRSWSQGTSDESANQNIEKENTGSRI